MSNEEQTEDSYESEPKAHQISRRGFDGTSLATEGVATQALIAKATADIQARWLMALRNPRDMAEVRQKIMLECKRPGFADAAIYEVPRGTDKIKGLSIRFAEVALRCLGNASCEAQTLYDSDSERIIRITATDFETNATWSRDITVKKTVERKFLKKGQRAIRDRINSAGDRIYIVEATDDDVATKEAALISKASRTAILRLIPGHLQDEAFALCEKTYADKAAKDPEAEKNQMLDAFAGQNIMPSAIAEWLGHAIELTTPAELVELRKLFGALRDGEVTWPGALEAAAASRAKRAEPAAAKTDTAKAPAASATPSKTSPAEASAPMPAPAAASVNEPPPPQQTSSGKGTSSVKDKLRSVPKDDPVAQPDPPKADVVSADQLPAPDFVERECATCGVAIDVPKDAPDGARCYVCRSA